MFSCVDINDHTSVKYLGGSYQRCQRGAWEGVRRTPPGSVSMEIRAGALIPAGLWLQVRAVEVLVSGGAGGECLGLC